VNQSIRYSFRDGVARIILAKPPSNTLDTTMLQEIHDVLDPFRDDPDLKLVVFDAEGETFSTGISAEAYQPDHVVEMLNVFNHVIEHLNQLSVPSLALVKGSALGGGFELALFCDIVLAAETAVFGVPEIGMGLFAPTAAIILPQIAGRNRALELMLTGEIISAQEAARIGLVNHVYPSAEFDAAAEAMIQKISRHSAAGLRFNHRAVDEVRLLPFDRAIRHLEDLFLNQLMLSEDAREGIAAYLHKRMPVWKNR
jgi:cyclohexa-1,5-dienecarbonyl-CoA hydratase